MLTLSFRHEPTGVTVDVVATDQTCATYDLRAGTMTLIDKVAALHGKSPIEIMAQSDSTISVIAKWEEETE
jgi:hypothetical protein